MSLLSCLFYHVSCIMSCVSCIMSHVSCILSHASCLLSCVSGLASSVSRLLSRVSCLMSLVLSVVSFLFPKSQWIGGAFCRVARNDAGGHGFKPWMVFIFPKCVKKLSAINTWKSAKYQNCPQLTPNSVLQKPKMSKVNHKRNVINFRNLSQCPRNTQALTTENVRLLKTVYSTVDT